MDDWVALIKSAPPGAPWAQQVRDSVEQIAADRHEDISGRLPAAAAGPAPAAAALGADQQQIRGMVDGLDARLRAQPKDLQGWTMLMRARMVLGEPQAAQDALKRGLAALAGDASDQSQLTTAARSLQVPGS
jgi:cytochrome c-type biogenesis protein CcmH